MGSARWLAPTSPRWFWVGVGTSSPALDPALATTSGPRSTRCPGPAPETSNERLRGCYPLWGRDSEGLYGEFCDLGYRAVTVCVDSERLTAGHCGQLLTPAFRASLPEGADPCGERGEYHSFTFDGPPFRRPVAFRPGGLHRQGPFVFQELYPGDEAPLAAGAERQGQGHVATAP